MLSAGESYQAKKIDSLSEAEPGRRGIWFPWKVIIFNANII